ncbi:MAG: hypothetical protein LBC65_01670, partial [Oscillospiraceae bacterium]|nr:hypothetical protein [Oscillospiraceae bacterium]
IESIADAWLTYLERSGDYEGAIALLSELDFSDSDAIRQRVSAKWIEALKLEGDYQAAYELTATLGLADTALRQRAIEAESIAAACAAEFRVLLDEPESFRIRGVWFNVTGDADAEITGLVLQIDGRGVDGAIASNYAIFERGESGYRFVWSISDGFAAQPEGRGTEAERRALQTMLKDAARFNVAAMLTANPAPVENSLVSVAAIQRLAETGKLEKVEIVDGGNRK